MYEVVHGLNILTPIALEHLHNPTSHFKVRSMFIKAKYSETCLVQALL